MLPVPSSSPWQSRHPLRVGVVWRGFGGGCALTPDAMLGKMRLKLVFTRRCYGAVTLTAMLSLEKRSHTSLPPAPVVSRLASSSSSSSSSYAKLPSCLSPRHCRSPFRSPSLSLSTLLDYNSKKMDAGHAYPCDTRMAVSVRLVRESHQMCHSRQRFLVS